MDTRPRRQCEKDDWHGRPNDRCKCEAARKAGITIDFGEPQSQIIWRGPYVNVNVKPHDKSGSIIIHFGDPQKSII